MASLLVPDDALRAARAGPEVRPMRLMSPMSPMSLVSLSLSLSPTLTLTLTLTLYYITPRRAAPRPSTRRSTGCLPRSSRSALRTR